MTVSGHALHEKGLQRQIRRLFTGQQPVTQNDRTPADKPRINRLLTANTQVANRGVCSSISLHRISFVRASEESSRTVVFDPLDGKKVVSPGEQTRRRPNPPRPASPRLASSRPVPSRTACDMFGCWTRQVSNDISYLCIRFKNNI